MSEWCEMMLSNLKVPVLYLKLKWNVRMVITSDVMRYSISQAESSTPVEGT